MVWQPSATNCVSATAAFHSCLVPPGPAIGPLPSSRGVEAEGWGPAPGRLPEGFRAQSGHWTIAPEPPCNRHTRPHRGQVHAEEAEGMCDIARKCRHRRSLVVSGAPAAGWVECLQWGATARFSGENVPRPDDRLLAPAQLP